ncbi:MAG: hypothetical protein LBF22_00760 [Deltaproteobacteria bacterium]|jgi:hypothetical protein|nr:hypothetical protein [Deltaproteobacteria bacterium]
MDDNNTSVETNDGQKDWELMAPDGETLNLAKEVALSIDSVARRLRLASEVVTDANQMRGWFVGKKRTKILSDALSIRDESEKELSGISQASINYSTTSFELANDFDKALNHIALSGISEGKAEEPHKISKIATDEISKISEAIDSFLKSYSDVKVQLSATSDKDTLEEGADESPIVEGEPIDGKGESAPELLGNKEQSLDFLKETLDKVNREAEAKDKEIDTLVRQVEKYHSKGYLEQKKLNASVSNTVGTLERSLTENKLRHNRLEKNIIELSSKVSITLDRLQNELRGHIKEVEDSGNQKLMLLHGKVDDHKEEHKDRLDAISLSQSSLKESLDIHTKNYEELSSGLKDLNDKLSELELRNLDSTSTLQRGIDELKSELAKANEEKSDKFKQVIIFAWGVVVSVIAVAALIGAWF